MNREKALKTLRYYNKWRRDNHIPNNIPMPDPKEVGEAIDVAIRTLRMCRALDRVHVPKTNKHQYTQYGKKRSI